MERELVLRLASVLWRLRRAAMMETGLFEIQAEHLRGYRDARAKLLPKSKDVIHGLFGERDAVTEHASDETGATSFDFAQCFLRLANLPNFALDRLSRYETTLWRQVSRILFTLDNLDRRKPQSAMPSHLLGLDFAD